MKLSFSFKKQEANFEADVEKLIEKGMDQREKNPNRKTRYQIKQEEKRKNAELKHKQEIQRMIIGISMLVGFIVIILIICAIGSSMNW